MLTKLFELCFRVFRGFILQVFLCIPCWVRTANWKRIKRNLTAALMCWSDWLEYPKPHDTLPVLKQMKILVDSIYLLSLHWTQFWFWELGKAMLRILWPQSVWWFCILSYCHKTSRSNSSCTIWNSVAHEIKSIPRTFDSKNSNK